MTSAQFDIFGRAIPQRIADLEPPYRYTLEDQCLDGGRTLVWCMLNPSTADATRDDATSRKIAGFTERACFGRWLIVNVYAYQATDPKELWAARARDVDIFGPRNEDVIRQVSRAHWNCVVAWGGNLVDTAHASRVLDLLRSGGMMLYTLGPERTKSGQPRHPLYVPYSTPLVSWDRAAA